MKDGFNLAELKQLKQIIRGELIQDGFFNNKSIWSRRNKRIFVKLSNQIKLNQLKEGK